MQWLDGLNASMAYIEENLEGTVELARAAQLAGCSQYHYQRMFSYIAGVPFSEYLRRRRMTRAAQDLQRGEKVLEVALKYGYESPTAFNRAFQGIHEVTPSAAQKEGTSLRVYSPISFTLTVKGEEKMEYHIEKKDSFRIIGLSSPLDQNLEKNFDVVPKLWEKAAVQGAMQQMPALMDTPIKGVLGVSACVKADNWAYYIAVASTQPAPEGWEAYTVPALTWAVFSGTGAMPDAIQSLEKRMVTEWLPTSGYEYDDGPDIELYLSPDPQNAVFQVWMPVKKVN